MLEMYIIFSVTMVKPETVSIYQVKKTEKDTYKKRTNWRLKDLKLIDGIDETSVSVLVYRTKNIIKRVDIVSWPFIRALFFALMRG